MKFPLKDKIAQWIWQNVFHQAVVKKSALIGLEQQMGYKSMFGPFNNDSTTFLDGE